MAQFAVHRDRHDPKGPLLLDVQNDLIAGLDSRVVIPMYPLRMAPRMSLPGLSPVVDFNGKTYMLLVAQLSAIHATDLGDRLGDLPDVRGEVFAALDLLFTGI